MVVYFAPERKSWWNYVAPAATQLLGGVIQDQFAKSAEKRKYQMEQDAAAAEEQRLRDRVNYASGMFGDGAFDIRGNPSQAAENYQLFNMFGVSPDTQKALIETTGVPFQMTNVDAGNRNVQTTMDPLTGAIKQVEQEYGLNPTDVYKEDAATKRIGMSEGGATARARIAADTSRYGYDKTYEQALAEIQGKKDMTVLREVDARGNVAYTNPLTGEKRDPGIQTDVPTYGYDTTLYSPDNKLYPYNTRTGTRGDIGYPVAPQLDGNMAALMKLYPDLFDFDGNPRPGTEGLISGILSQLGASLGGGAGAGQSQGYPVLPQPQAPGALPPGVSEAQVSEMMKRTGKGRDEVIAYLGRRTALR
jgi:hypothetical protein